MGREGKQYAEFDAQAYPHTAAMAAKLQTPQGKAAYRRRKFIAESPNGWIKSVLGFRQFSLLRTTPCSGRVQTRVFGAELAAHGCDESAVRQER